MCGCRPRREGGAMLARTFWSLPLALGCSLCPAQQLNTNFDLLVAVRGGDLARAASLLDQGASSNSRNRLGDTPLNTAARNGKIEMVRLLLAHQADVELANLARVTPLTSAAYGGHDAIVRELL